MSELMNDKREQAASRRAGAGGVGPGPGLPARLQGIDHRHDGHRAGTDGARPPDLRPVPGRARHPAPAGQARQAVGAHAGDHDVDAGSGDRDPARSFDEAAEQLEHIRTTVQRAAFEVGASISGGGAHPFQKWNEQRIYPKERYFASERKFGYLAKLFTVFGMHVHIGGRHAGRGDARCAPG